MIHPRQVVAARGLLSWTQANLAEKAQIGPNTVKLFEKGKPNVRPVIITAMQRVLEDHGISFINEGEKIGVAMKVKAD